jgi:hypothetical protein
MCSALTNDVLFLHLLSNRNSKQLIVQVPNLFPELFPI